MEQPQPADRGASFLGTVGLDWQVSGFGDFSSRNEGDMLLRNINTGGLMLYDMHTMFGALGGRTDMFDGIDPGPIPS